MIIAVDFDETLCLNGKPNTNLFDYCRGMQCQGHQIVLYTSRQGKRVNEAVKFCASNGLMFNGVVGGKFRADLYIDDKAVKP